MVIVRNRCWYTCIYPSLHLSTRVFIHSLSSHRVNVAFELSLMRWRWWDEERANEGIYGVNCNEIHTGEGDMQAWLAPQFDFNTLFLHSFDWLMILCERVAWILFKREAEKKRNDTYDYSLISTSILHILSLIFYTLVFFLSPLVHSLIAAAVAAATSSERERDL